MGAHKVQEAFLWPNQRQKGPALVEVVSSPSLQVFKGGQVTAWGRRLQTVPESHCGWGGVGQGQVDSRTLVLPGPSGCWHREGLGGWPPTLTASSRCLSLGASRDAGRASAVSGEEALDEPWASESSLEAGDGASGPGRWAVSSFSRSSR